MDHETFSVRIPKELGEDVRRLPVNWQEEVRHLTDRIRAEMAGLLVEGGKAAHRWDQESYSADSRRG